MQRIFLLALMAMFFTPADAQLNMEFRSSISYDETANDIWGYADGAGREYALVGLRTGVSVIDVTDPDNPVDLGKADGPASTWRDIKTWGTYAYTTTEDGNDGILVMDLSNLPAALTTDDWYYVKPTLPVGPDINTCHNIYIDEFGFAYLTGCQDDSGDRINNGGPIIYDMKVTEGQFDYAGQTPPVYAHDAYVINNKLYTSDIYVGEFSIYDVTDKSNLQLLGTQQTEFTFTHNVWLSDDQNIAFTTDERANAPVGSYDVSDPNNIVELDQFRPLETLGEGVIPHNTHVWNDYLIVSYYSDGCILVDASEPDHLIEVGNFDTYIPAQQGFNGAWGAYPFLPSQTVLVSDIAAGLYVLTPTYKRAARLKGTVVDSLTGMPLNNVEVIIASDQTNFVNTDFQGKYKTGVADAGTYDVTYTKFGYEPKTVTYNLENGVIIDEVTELSPKATITGIVRVESNGNPISGATVNFMTSNVNESAVTGNDGTFTFPIEPGTYEVFVGAWGYKTILENRDIENGSELIFDLVEGYQDEFAVDLGWTVTGTATAGIWERGEPVGTTNQGSPSNPNFDLPDDLSDQCYVTGNGGGQAGFDDVDGGTTILTSQAIDLTGMLNPKLNFTYWFYNSGGQGTPNDYLNVAILKDGNTIQVERFDENVEWTAESFNIEDFVTIDGTIQIEFTGIDQSPGHLSESAIDGFSITADMPSSVSTISSDEFLQVQPNPFNESIKVDYALEQMNDATLQVLNVQGQLIQTIDIAAANGSVILGQDLTVGVYFLQLINNQTAYAPTRVVKIK